MIKKNNNKKRVITFVNDYRLTETIEAKSNNHRYVRIIRVREIKLEQRESNDEPARLSLLRFQIR